MGFLPDNYVSTNDDNKSSAGSGSNRYFEPKSLADGESTTLRPCGTHDTGHVICGWTYFNMDGKPRRFPQYPQNYLDDIGLTWEGKNNGTGEKDRPKYFLSFTALRREGDEFVIVTIAQKGVREQFEEILSMEDYQFLGSGMANFYLTLKRKGEKLDTTYTMLPTLKAPVKADEKRWSEAKGSIWLPALYVNADPFAGPPADARPEGLPPTRRDELGADQEVATSGMPSSWD
jgi:hypothetical protein